MKLYSVSILTALTATTLNAAVLSQWTDPADLGATTTLTGMKASTVSRGDGLASDGANGDAQGYFISKNQNSTNDLGSGDYPGLAGAITNGIYYSFTIGTLDSSAFDIDGVFFDNLALRSNTDPGTFSLLSDVGGFTTTSPVLASTSAGSDLNWAPIDTSFDGLTSDVEFRLYFHDGSIYYKELSIGVKNDTLADIEVTGAVVPEPSTYALLAGFLALGLVMVRRRRRD